jgi:hypothetical protein
MVIIIKNKQKTDKNMLQSAVAGCHSERSEESQADGRFFAALRMTAWMAPE